MEPNSDSDINILLKHPFAVAFDPIELAELSDSQAALMEPFAICLRQLKDGNGLRIMFQMDFWLIAQMIKMLFNADGSAKTPQEVTCQDFRELFSNL